MKTLTKKNNFVHLYVRHSTEHLFANGSTEEPRTHGDTTHSNKLWINSESIPIQLESKSAHLFLNRSTDERSNREPTLVQHFQPIRISCESIPSRIAPTPNRIVPDRINLESTPNLLHDISPRCFKKRFVYLFYVRA